MRKLMTVAAVIAAVGFASGVALANPSAKATKKVNVFVEETVGVSSTATGAYVDGGVIETEKFDISVPFMVDCNTQYVDMKVCATDLFKADVPGGDYVIPLDDSGGALIAGSGFTPTSQFVRLNGTPEQAALGGYTWDFACSEPYRFHSSQSGRFSWPVDVTVDWDQGDYELPTGDYSGYVRLWVYVVP